VIDGQMRAQARQRSGYCAEVKRVSGWERVPGVAGPRYPVAVAMNHDAIRTFAVDQAFEYMRQDARNGDAAQHVVRSARDLVLRSAQPRIRPE
jgi:hypothetical protein